MKSLSRVRLLVTPWTAAHQAPPSTWFSRQEYWSGVPLPSPDACLRSVEFIETGPVLLLQNSQLPAQVHNGPSQFGNSRKAATSPATVIGAGVGKAGEKKKEKGEIEEGEAGEGATETGAAGAERRGNVGITWSRRERGEAGETRPGEGRATGRKSRDYQMPPPPPLWGVLCFGARLAGSCSGCCHGAACTPQPPLHNPHQVLPRHQPHPPLPQDPLHPLLFRAQGLHLSHHPFLIK